MTHFDPTASSQGKKIVTAVVAITILSGAVFFGLKQFMQWHEKTVKNAVDQATRRQEMISAEKSAALLKKIDLLSRDLELLKPVEVPEDRVDEVFGGPVPEQPDCEALGRQFRAFFAYLDRKNAPAPNAASDTAPVKGTDDTNAQKSVVDEEAPAPSTETAPPGNAGEAGKDTYSTFTGMIKDLSAHPPIVIGETRDMVSLIRNRTHFFRVLNAERIKMVIRLLSTEKDILEHAMAVFYSYYFTGGCCKDQVCVSPDTAYDYAGFFLNTLSGQSYLIRRDTAVRSLTRYYSILILNQANDNGINSYGIDIRPHIDLAIDDLRSQKNLMLKDRYIAALEILKEKYAIKN